MMTDSNTSDCEITSKILKRTLCENCKIKEYKYKCPRCSMKTCCLICVKDHKKKSLCTGQKDKFTARTDLVNFTEKELVQDIRFLNETLNETNKASKKIFNLNDDEVKKDKEKKNKYNRKCARKFRNLNLYNSPMIMTRFSENKSYIDYKNKKFFWTVKFIISQQEKRFEHIFKVTFDDSENCLNDIINYLYANKQELELPLLMFINNLPISEILNSQILYKLNLKEMDKNLIIGKFVKLNKMHYEECNKTILLKDLFNGKDILEYPEFYVMISSDLGNKNI